MESVYVKKNKWITVVKDVFLGIVFSSVLTILISLLFGYQYLNILTNSMAPTMPAGTMIIIQKTPFQSLQVGDVITYKINTTNVTHRITEINAEEEVVYTKGDNVSGDGRGERISKNMVQGRVITYVPELGRFITFLTNQFNFMLIIVIVVLGAFIYAFY